MGVAVLLPVAGASLIASQSAGANTTLTFQSDSSFTPDASSLVVVDTYDRTIATVTFTGDTILNTASGDAFSDAAGTVFSDTGSTGASIHDASGGNMTAASDGDVTWAAGSGTSGLFVVIPDWGSAGHYIAVTLKHSWTLTNVGVPFYWTSDPSAGGTPYPVANQTTGGYTIVSSYLGHTPSTMGIAAVNAILGGTGTVLRASFYLA
jgi:hypothetical protein